jgi:hypothetical protein
MGEERMESGYWIWYYWLDCFYPRIVWLDMNCSKAWRFSLFFAANCTYSLGRLFCDIIYPLPEGSLA